MSIAVSDCLEGRKEIFYLTTHSTYFIYGYMASDHSDSEKGNRCRHIGYSFRLTARVLLYAPSHRQDSTYHGPLLHTSRGALAGTRNSSVGSPHEGSIRRPIAPWANALTTELYLAPMTAWMPRGMLDTRDSQYSSWVISVTQTPWERDVAHGAVGRWIDPSLGGPIELFLVPASAPRLV